MEKYTFQPVQYDELVPLRNRRMNDLKGQEYDSLEEQIELASPLCLLIRSVDEVIGYALVDDTTLAEFYIVYAYRKKAMQVLDQLIANCHVSHWHVNSQDSFALPLMLEKGCLYKLDAPIFSMNPCAYHDHKLENEEQIVMADSNDLQLVYQLVMEDGFYTGNGQDALASCINNHEIYLLYSQETPVGVGFVSPMRRTPEYADIAMMIHQPYRKMGFASKLVSQLVAICCAKGLIPTALTSIDNIASRKTLEKCGFYIDGYMLLAEINNKVI
jgi:GNAT superfamily N-acetyltransferase